MYIGCEWVIGMSNDNGNDRILSARSDEYFIMP